MTTSDALLTGLKSCLTLAGLWWLLFWLYRDFRLDVFRQELFTLRDRTFDLATERKLSYDHPAYGTLRRTINGFIRFGHRLSLPQVLLLVITYKFQRARPIDSFGVRWQHVVADLPGSLRAELDAIVWSMHKVVLKHLIISSPLLILSMATVIIPILLCVAWYFQMDRLIRRLGKPLRLIDSVAVAYGA